jgi:hypothetical protein
MFDRVTVDGGDSDWGSPLVVALVDEFVQIASVKKSNKNNFIRWQLYQTRFTCENSRKRLPPRARGRKFR